MEQSARLRHAFTLARRTAVLLTTLAVAVVAIPASAHAAAPQPITRTVVGQSATALHAVAPAQLASYSNPGCAPFASSPDVSGYGDGRLFVWGGGQIACTRNVARIDVDIVAYHDGGYYGISHGTATASGYKLYSVTQIFAPACQPGSWYFVMSGDVIGLSGQIPYQGWSGVTSSTVYTNC